MRGSCDALGDPSKLTPHRLGVDEEVFTVRVLPVACRVDRVGEGRTERNRRHLGSGTRDRTPI
ncbi:hypothetical protein [Rhodococcus sp. ZPP]|uniref:hypothetical protein n=1 Tax=Rhodococcus sp. ZPP TaxID=2749906 RepID=UPI001FCAF139|nr:hypothetical protein [Rhodococcus sp. ZPP]